MPIERSAARQGNKSFPELAEALRSQSEAILKVWMDELRQEIPPLAAKSDTELRDNLPNIMAGMAEYLSAADGAKKLVAESPLQGSARFHQNYDIRSLMHEDRVLRSVVIRHVEATLRRRLTLEEQLALDAGIDVMLQRSVIAFIDHQNERLRLSAESELKYLSFLSHDLNNNLGSVTLFLQVLRQRLADFPEFTEEVETLDQAQASILNTIGGMSRLLQNERLRNGGVAMKIAPVHLHRLASNVTHQAMRAAEGKGLRLAVEVPPDAIVPSDGELITLVLQNILGNAVKYSSKGVVRISAKPLQETRGNRWELTVSDEGPGIAGEQVARIFDAFKRGESHGQTGVGLGLAIASQAAKLLGAELTVESTLGIGSTFRLVLPGESDAADGGGATNVESANPH